MNATTVRLTLRGTIPASKERVPVELLSDYLVRRFTISGTPGESIDRVRELRSIGVESVLLTPPEYAWQETTQRWPKK